MSLALSLALLAQVGAAPPLNLPSGLEDRQRRSSATAPIQATAAPKSPLDECMAALESDPAAALDMAEGWLEEAKGSAAAPAQFCLGSAQAALGRWEEAEQAFLAGRDLAAASDYRLRAQLGAMAGVAALSEAAPERALAAFDRAHADAISAPDAQLAGDIQVDRSRALMGLKREDEADRALAESRTSSPDNPESWLLSATLSRRQDKLAEAQAQIERAAELAPRDPQVGLEAGVIAVLSGREEAARRSWQSVIAAAPDSELAALAKDYLDQLESPRASATAAP